MAALVNQDISPKELNRRNFIVNGNLWKVVFVIAFPLFIYSLFNYFYGIIDTIMCANLSKAAVNAVGALTQIDNMIAAIGGGIGAGGSILIARQIGRKDYVRAKKLANSVFFYTFILAALTCLVVLPFAAPLLSLFGVTQESINVGLGYFEISVVTSAVMMLNSVYIGIEKAKGSTLLITILNIAVVLFKVALNALFIYGFKIYDMTFVSLSTLIANGALLVYILIRLSMKNYLFHFEWKNLDLSTETVGKVTAISFPVFLGKFIFSLGKVVINGLCYSFGDDVVGALGVSNNIGGAVTNPLSSIEDSTSSIISQNLGAHKSDRAIKSFYIGLVYSLSIALVGILFVTIFDSEICHYFAQKAGEGIADPAEAAAAVESYAQLIHDIFFYEKLGIMTLAINSSVLGLLYGFGFTKLSMIINIMRVFVFRIPSFLVCEYALGLTGAKCAGIAMGFSNISIGIVAVIAAFFVIVRIKRREKEKEGAKMLSKEELKALDMYIGNYLSSYSHYKEGAAWCYEDGVLLKGAMDLYKVTRDEKYLSFCIDYFNSHIGPEGELNQYDINDYNLDNLQPGVALYYVNQAHHEEKFPKALALLAKQIESQPRTKSGSFWHKERYPNQIWLDGLYMAGPFYAIQATTHNSQAMKKDLVLQFANVEKFNFDPVSHQFYHAFDETKSLQWASKETGRSPNVWLRSVGWFAMATVDVATTLKQSYAFFSEKKIQPMIGECLASLKPFEDQTTHMYKDLVAVEDPRNYLETSGSLMVAYTYMKAARVGFLPREKMKDGIAIFEGVVRHSLKNGHLENIVKVSGLDNLKRDGSVDYYLSEEVVADDPKGVGPLLMAYAEYLSMPY